MAEVIEPLATSFLGGNPIRVDRSTLQATLTIAARTASFAAVLDDIVAPEEASGPPVEVAAQL